MSTRDINRRLDKLDALRPAETPRRVISIVRDEDEPMAAAIERWCAAHPGEPPPSPDDDNTLIIMHTIVSPKPSTRGDSATGGVPATASPEARHEP